MTERKIGGEHGLHGRVGGWIYDDDDGEPVVQGWWWYFDRYRRSGELVEQGSPTRYFVNETK